MLSHFNHSKMTKFFKFKKYYLLILLILGLCLPELGALPVNPDGAKKEESASYSSAAKKRATRRVYQLNSAGAGIDRLYLVAFIGAILCYLGIGVIAFLATYVFMGFEAIGLLLILGGLSSIFAILGIIASILAIRASKLPEFMAHSQVYWKALVLGILAVPMMIFLLWSAIASGGSLALWVLFLFSLIIGALHFTAAGFLKKK